MKGLTLLSGAVSRTPDISTWAWATVTDDSPLRVQLDGEAAPLDLTPDSLVSGLAVDDRVWVQLVANADPGRRHRRVVIVGKSSGQIIVAGSVTNAQLANMATQTFKGRTTAGTGSPEDLTLTQARELLALPNVVCTRFVIGSNTTTTSTAYANLSTGISISITKRHAATKLLVRVEGTWFFADGSGTGGGGVIALQVNSTDYPVVNQPLAVPTAQRVGFSGSDSISGLAAQAWTVQARWKAQTSGKAVQMNATDDTITLTAMEVWS